MWSKNAHSEVGRGIRRVFAIHSGYVAICTQSYAQVLWITQGTLWAWREPTRGDIVTKVVGHFFGRLTTATLFPKDKWVLKTKGHRPVSESAEEVPGEESLATAKLRADVARQQMRLAKDQLKRARKRFKEARREARRARKLAALARRAWKRQKRKGNGIDKAPKPAAAGAPSNVARRAQARPATRAARKRSGKTDRKTTRSSARRRSRGKSSPAATGARKRRQ